jgi:hypothetical protein
MTRALLPIASLVGVFTLTATATAFECRTVSDCTPCVILDGDDTSLSVEHIKDHPTQCQPWRRQEYALQAACVSHPDNCQLDYQGAILMLQPLQCVKSQVEGDACAMSADWQDGIDDGRKLLDELSKVSALEVTFENLPEGASVVLAGSQHSHALIQIGDGTYRQLKVYPGEYMLRVSKGEKQLHSELIDLTAGASLKKTVKISATSPSSVGFWVAGSAVLAKDLSGSAGAKGAIAGTIAPVQWLDIDVGVAGSRLFWGGLLGGKAIVDWRSLRFAAEPHLLLFGGRHEAARDVLWGVHLGGRVGYRWDDAYTLFVAPAAEVYPNAEPYDSVLYLVSIGFEWRKQ